MKILILTGSLILLSSCGRVITDPIGEPFRLELRPTQVAAGANTVNLAAFVDYGPFGGVPATVEFLNGTQVLATTSEREVLTPTAEEPWDFKYQRQVNLQLGTTYNLTARISWTSNGIEKSLTSEVVKFQLQ